MKILYLLAWLLLSSFAHAQERWVDLEWDAVPGAKGYEVELLQDLSGTKTPRGTFKTEVPLWSRPVTSGKYSLRIRSLDPRGVPGEWSEEIPLKIRLKNPQLLRPVPNDKVTDNQTNLEWSEVEGADSYQVVLLGPGQKVLLNSVTKELKFSTYLSALGEYSWSVFALEASEPVRSEEEWPRSQFRSFAHAGGELGAPFVAVRIDEKVTISWNRVPNAEVYEVDYVAPPGSGQKNTRFKVKNTSAALSKKTLRDGTTTLTVKALAKGHVDSRKSIVKIERTGDRVEVAEILQGKQEEVVQVDPTLAYWRTQYYLSILAGSYAYDSTNVETDTVLKQKKLTGLGINLDVHYRPRLNSYLHKFNAALLNLSSGIDSGQLTHLSYTLNALSDLKRARLHYGLGVGYLGVPSFMGDRLADKVGVEQTTGIGPELDIGLAYSLAPSWLVDVGLQYLYQVHFLNSERDNPSSYGYTRGTLGLLNYITKNQAIFTALEYRSWEQKWSRDLSTISGLSLCLGLKGHF